MPTYQYQCTDCGEPLEVVQSFSDDALTECPTCQGRLRKVYGSVGVVFKGSGFYRNDSRSDSKSSSSSGGASTSTSSSGTSDSGSGSGSGSDSGSGSGSSDAGTPSTGATSAAGHSITPAAAPASTSSS